MIYVHIDKHVEPGLALKLGDTQFKWYAIAPPDMGVPGDIDKLARRFLTRELEAGDLAGLGDFGFVILHHCGSSFYFLLVSTWKNDNELWESVYAKQSDEHDDFAEFPLAQPHHATFCVWELAAVCHEQKAWRRFLLSERDEDATMEYLEDQYRGMA